MSALPVDRRPNLLAQPDVKCEIGGMTLMVTLDVFGTDGIEYIELGGSDVTDIFLDAVERYMEDA